MGEKSFFGANKEEEGWEGEGDAITLTAVGKNCMGNTAWRGKHREGRVSIGVFLCVTRPPSFLADSPRMGEKGRNALDIHIHNK